MQVSAVCYRNLLHCETLQMNIDMKYSLKWNAYQQWLFKFTGSKASASFIFAHKWFFQVTAFLNYPTFQAKVIKQMSCFDPQDMIDDWAGKTAPDILYHIPYEWKFVFVLKKYELITLANEFNWIDIDSSSTVPEENSKIAICGDHMNLKFTLPYLEFLPATILYNFVIEASLFPLKKNLSFQINFMFLACFFLQGSKVDLSLLLPETNTSRDILRSLDLNAKVSTRDGKWRWKREENEGKWRQFCSFEDGWVDTWSAPRVSLNIEFLFHPVPLAGPPPQADVPTPEKEKKLLGPLHAPFPKSSTLQVCSSI